MAYYLDYLTHYSVVASNTIFLALCLHVIFARKLSSDPLWVPRSFGLDGTGKPTRIHTHLHESVVEWVYSYTQSPNE